MKQYASFNLWANGIVASYLNQKPADILRAQVVSSYPSLQSTLDHIVYTEGFWIDILRDAGKTSHLSEPVVLSGHTLEDLLLQSRLLNKIVQGFDDAHFAQRIRTPWIEQPIPLYEVLHHCFNHSTYHRGQLPGMLRQLGFQDIPMTDYYEFMKVHVYR